MQGLRPLQRYFDFSGRSGRAEYWQWIAVTTVAGWVTGILDALSSTPYEPSHKVTAILAMGTFIPSLAVGIRRFHDRGKSGWHFGIFCILLGLAFGMLLIGDQIKQRTGDDSFLGVGVVVALIWFIYAIYCIVQLAKPGDAHANAYGEPDLVAAPNYLEPLAKAVTPAPPRAAVNMDETLNAIERLGRMREQGLLSDEEFVAQKQQLLAKVTASSVPPASERS